MGRLASGNHLDRCEHIEAANRQLDQSKQDCAANRGQRYVSELLPSPAAVNVRRFIQILRHLLQGGQEYHHIPADPLPYSQDHRHTQAAPAAIQPTDIATGYSKDLPKEIVQQAFRIEDISEYQRCDHPGRHDREIIDDTESDAESFDSIQKNSYEQPNRHLPGNRNQGIDDTVDKHGPEGGILKDLPVVQDSGKGLGEHG